MIRVKTIDAHAAGEPLRLIVDGFPSPRGATMLEKREWVRRHADHFRRALMLEPRGHADMYGALLTEPVTADAHAGVLFMHNEGWSTMCGHGIVAVTTMAVDRGLITAASDELRYDTPAGRVVARAHRADAGPGARVKSVSFVNVPSFVFEAGVPIQAGGRALRVDVAFGGAFYAIADSEAAGLPILPERLPELRVLG